MVTTNGHDFGVIFFPVEESLVVGTASQLDVAGTFVLGSVTRLRVADVSTSFQIPAVT